MPVPNPASGSLLPATDTSQVVLENVREENPVVLFDPNEPRSLLNLLPKNMKEAIEDAVFQEPDLFAMDELVLYKHLKEKEMGLTPTDNRLRVRFWFEYDYCQATHQKGLEWKRIIAGICSYEHFFRNVITKPHKVAWLLCPPTSYAVKTNEALDFGLEQLRDILSADHTVGGKIDSKLGELKLKIVALLDTRVKGAPIQRNIVANLSGKAATDAVQRSISGGSMENMEKRLKDLEKREKELLNGGQVRTIEVKPQES